MTSDEFDTAEADQADDAADGATLGEVVLGYEPIVDSKRRIKMMRLKAHPLPGRPLPDLRDLYREIARALPDGSKPMLLSVPAEGFSAAVRKCSAHPNLLLEVPAEAVQDAHGHHLISTLRLARFRLVLRGEVPASLPPSLRSSFVYHAAPAPESVRLGQPHKPVANNLFGTVQARRIPMVMLGIDRLAQMQSAFDHGASCTAGWPFVDAFDWPRQSTVIPSFTTISDLITRLNRGDDVAALENVIRQDPALAYRLLQLINSAAYGLRVEVTSFRHAVMMLGYEKLKRWLSLLLSTSSREPTMQPIMFASFVRGVLLEKLVSDVEEEKTRDELFTLGVFSLIDRIFGKPIEELLKTLHFAPEIHAALVEDSGPYAPYLRLVQALESGAAAHVPERLEQAFISLRECNSSLLHTLADPGFPTETEAV